MNAAFMAKLRRNIEVNKHKTCVSFFSKKYSSLNPQIRIRNSSFVHKSILRNGNDINLQKDCQINNVPLQNQLIGPLPKGRNGRKKVSTLISISKDLCTWNLYSIPFPLPQDLTNTILGIDLPHPFANTINSTYGTYQNLNENGNFTLK